MSKSGPFSCRTVQNSRVAAKTERPSPKPPRTPEPRRMPHNRKSANKTRPAPSRGAGLASSRLIAKSRKRGIWVAHPSPGETKPASFIAGPSPKSTGRRSASPPSRGQALRERGTLAHPRAATRCAGKAKRPAAPTPRSRCGVGARRPGRRRSRRPRTSR